MDKSGFMLYDVHTFIVIEDGFEKSLKMGKSLVSCII